MSKTLFFPFPIDGEQRLHWAMLVQVQLQPKRQDKNAESHINHALSPRQPSGHQRRVRRSTSKMKAACFGRMLSHFPRQRKVFSAVQHFLHAGVLLEFDAQFELSNLRKVKEFRGKVSALRVCKSFLSAKKVLV